MLRFTKAAGTGSKLWFRRFFYVLFRGLLYLAMYLRANGDNMVWCEINMQGLPFPCEEQSPTLRGSEVGRGDTQDGTCGWAHGGTMAGREAGCRGARHLLRRRAKAHLQRHTPLRQERRWLRAGMAGLGGAEGAGRHARARAT